MLVGVQNWNPGTLPGTSRWNKPGKPGWQKLGITWNLPGIYSGQNFARYYVFQRCTPLLIIERQILIFKCLVTSTTLLVLVPLMISAILCA